MKNLQILMPMGGLGSRFSKAGYTTPKPLIEVDGRPMFLKAASSFDNIDAPKTFTFVIRQEHVDEFALDELIKNALPKAKLIVIDKVTRGAAETALRAYPSLDPEAALVVMDCDLYFKSPDYDKIVTKALSDDSIDGALLTFNSDNPRYSYAQVDRAGNVTRTAEKKPISDRALIGAYFFGKAISFKQAADKLLLQPISEEIPEYYMSLVYNFMLQDGQNIKAAASDTFDSFGTPEELSAYVEHHNG